MSLRRAAASGVVWMGGATAVATLLRIGTLAVIARALTQSELGLVSMLLAIVILIQAFSDFGLSAQIIQKRDLSRGQLSSAFWFAQLIGVAAFSLVVVSQSAIVELYGEPRLDGLIPGLAVRFLLAPVSLPYLAMLQRDLEFKRAFWVQTIAAASGSVVTIAGAWVGWGVYAMIAGEVASAIASAILALALGWRVWRPEFRLRIADVRASLRFSLLQLGERVFGLFATNIDYILIGRVLGPEALAAYALAFEITSTPARLNSILTRVALPILARRQDDPSAFQRGFLDMIRLIALVQLPVLMAIAMLAPLLIPLLFGPGWDAVVPLVQILSLFGAIRVLGNPSGPTFLAKGRPELGFYFNLVVAALALFAFRMVVDRGTEAIAWTWVALIGAQLVALIVILNSLVGTTWASWARTLGRSFAIVALGAAAFWAALLLAGVLTSDPRLAFAISAGVGGLATVALVWWIERAFVRSMLSLLRREKP